MERTMIIQDYIPFVTMTAPTIILIVAAAATILGL